MNTRNISTKVFAPLLTLISGFLLWLFSMGRADTMEQFYSGILTTWIFLASVCAFTAYLWFKIFTTNRKALIPAIAVWLAIGTAYTIGQVSVMKHRQKTAEENQKQQSVEQAVAGYPPQGVGSPDP